MGTSVQNAVHEGGCKTVSVPLPYHTVCGVSWTSLSICRWESSQSHPFTMKYALNELCLWLLLRSEKYQCLDHTGECLLSYVKTVRSCDGACSWFILLWLSEADKSKCKCQQEKLSILKSPRCASEPVRTIQTTAMDHPEEGTMNQHRHNKQTTECFQ